MKNLYNTYFIVTLLLATFHLSAQNFNNLYTLPDVPDNNLSSTQSSMVIDADGSVVTIQNNEEGPSSPLPESNNALVAKVDVNGNLLWMKQLGDQNYDDEVNGICKTDDGGYLIVGSRGKPGIEYRSWVIRLDNSGTLLWHYLVPQQGTGTESLLVMRTSETAENYMIIGKTRSFSSLTGERLTAMKISGFGAPFWHYIYNRVNLFQDLDVSDVPTSIIQDTQLSGVVVAGLRTNDNFTGGGGGRDGEGGSGNSGSQSGEDIFTIGFGLDGSISRDYKRHNISNGFESKPHIIQDSRSNGQYVLVCGTDSGGFGSSGGSHFTFMSLAPDLTPLQVSHYSNDHYMNTSNTANAIHADANGNYGVSCNTSDTNGYILGSFNQASFLYLDDTGGEISYTRYNVGTNAKSVYMTHDGIQNTFVMKTLNQGPNQLGLGLIHTQMNGLAQCSDPANIERWQGSVESQIILNEEGGLNNNPMPFQAEEWDTYANSTSCEAFDNPQARSSQDAETYTQIDNIIAYPTLVDESTKHITLSLESPSDYEAELTIIDVQGRIISVQTVSVHKGSHNYDIEIHNLPSGTNTLMITNENKKIGTIAITKF